VPNERQPIAGCSLIHTRRYPSDCTDTEWALVLPLLPAPVWEPGVAWGFPPVVDDLQILPALVTKFWPTVDTAVR
jgi:hypothetical protein